MKTEHKRTKRLLDKYRKFEIEINQALLALEKTSKLVGLTTYVILNLLSFLIALLIGCELAQNQKVMNELSKFSLASKLIDPSMYVFETALLMLSTVLICLSIYFYLLSKATHLLKGKLRFPLNRWLKYYDYSKHFVFLPVIIFINAFSVRLSFIAGVCLGIVAYMPGVSTENCIETLPQTTACVIESNYLYLRKYITYLVAFVVGIFLLAAFYRFTIKISLLHKDSNRNAIQQKFYDLQLKIASNMTYSKNLSIVFILLSVMLYIVATMIGINEKVDLFKQAAQIINPVV
ncbi:hypothetical protein [Glaciecola sp. KUL10]|uniref:hypothetical protein n=1 Tax=Glaciecola sp. (strain KUL10) TaxID=2161813 RepID=UPI000D7838A1|nr:hypothetical protein [Glaciecola sp. KUL10]GBL03169.1 hypothetical protein KUL10_04500 [Glaciecola sp. KUL10]